MKFELYFDMGNDAFMDNLESEASKILADISINLQELGLPHSPVPIFDSNGNRIGELKVTRDKS